MTNLQCCVGDYQIQISSTNHLQTTGALLKVLSPTHVRLKEIQERNYLQYVKEFTSDFFEGVVCKSKYIIACLQAKYQPGNYVLLV